MRPTFALLALSLSTMPSAVAGQSAALQLNGRLIRPGTDSLGIYLVRGGDTARTGVLVDEIEVVQEAGVETLRRVYLSLDQLLGARVDTLVDVQTSLAPLHHRSRSARGVERLDYGAGVVTGVMREANGDSALVHVALPATVYNSSSVDLVLRAAPLQDGWQGTVPMFMPNTRTVMPLRAQVTASDLVDGDSTWRIDADFAGLPVTFWISKATRALRRQTMQFRHDATLLFARPKGEAPARVMSGGAAPGAFVTGMCPRPDGTGVPDLSTVVSEPAVPPRMIAMGLPFPNEVRRDGYRGRVVLPLVVDSLGRGVPGTGAVMSSTDPVLSEWACRNVDHVRFTPARENGRPVAAQAVQPFTYSASVTRSP